MMVCNCKVLNNEDLMKYGVGGIDTMGWIRYIENSGSYRLKIKQAGGCLLQIAVAAA